MCYNDDSNCYGKIKYINGNPIQSAIKVMVKKRLEVRIYLEQKYMRVFSLPDYFPIAELDDPNKIDPKVPYRLHFSMFN